MSTPTVPISESAHRVLQELATRTGLSAAEVLDQALYPQFGFAGCAGFGPAGAGSTASFGSVGNTRAPADWAAWPVVA